MPAAQKISSVVEQVVDHGDQVYTILLRPERAVPRFRPGQFLHLALDPYDPANFWPDSRVFSIASPPEDLENLQITYSVHGHFTARMARDLVPGRAVWIKLPYGDFVVGADGPAVLFAGGTGITAFMAFLEALRPESPMPVTVAYGARTERLLIYRDALDRCAARVPQLTRMYFAELTDAAQRQTTGEITCGRLSVAAVWPRLERPLQSQYYVSGPPAMLETIGEQLSQRGVAMEAIHTDAWQ